MPASLPVELNRTRLHAIEVPVEFAAEGSFHVDLTNHREGVHVHLHLDDDLSAVARLDDSNVYVSGDSTKRVDVVVDNAPSRAVTGHLKISTGYGAETSYVDVTVEPFDDEPRRVAVDESLSKPKPKQPAKEPSVLSSLAEAVPGPRVLPFVAFVFLAALIAFAAVFVVGLNSPAVLVGVGVVLGGSLAALVFLLR